MGNLKKWVSIIAVFFVAMIFLSGCGTQQSGTQNQSRQKRVALTKKQVIRKMRSNKNKVRYVKQHGEFVVQGTSSSTSRLQQSEFEFESIFNAHGDITTYLSTIKTQTSQRSSHMIIYSTPESVHANVNGSGWRQIQRSQADNFDSTYFFSLDAFLENADSFTMKETSKAYVFTVNTSASEILSKIRSPFRLTVGTSTRSVTVRMTYQVSKKSFYLTDIRQQVTTSRGGKIVTHTYWRDFNQKKAIESPITHTT